MEETWPYHPVIKRVIICYWYLDMRQLISWGTWISSMKNVASFSHEGSVASSNKLITADGLCYLNKNEFWLWMPKVPTLSSWILSSCFVGLSGPSGMMSSFRISCFYLFYRSNLQERTHTAFAPCESPCKWAQNQAIPTPIHSYKKN